MHEAFLPGRWFVFFFFWGVIGFVQRKNYAAAKENGQDALVIVEKKYIKSHGGKEFKVSYHQKDYWVRVARSTFDSGWVNKTIISKYDAENDTMIDERAGQDHIIVSILFIIGAVLFCWCYLKKD
jgi:hypothetical protein